MTKTLTVILLIGILFMALLPAPIEAVYSSADPQEVIVCFKENTAPSTQQVMEARYNYSVMERNEALNCALVRVKREDTQQIVNKLSREDSVRFVEPNRLVHALYTPNDPYYPEQWWLRNIKVDRAWDYEKGAKTVTIAILDTGIDYTHEDLADNYLAGGYDWVNDDSDPVDDKGHGTHCAGIAAATLDNHRGIAGIAQVNLMAEKVLDEGGLGTYWSVIQGITHAADNNANIISMSFGADEDGQALRNACQYAWNKGCLLVAASGNDYENSIDYPAAYETVIAVGATNQNNQRAAFSNWGANLELVAPGVGILSSYLSNLYAWGTGTSMATPHVAGVAALVWSTSPVLTNQDVRERLRQTADDLGAVGSDEYYGYGKVNAKNATNRPPTVTVLYPNGGEIVNGTITLRASAADPDSDETVTNVQFFSSSDNGTSWTSLTNLTMYLVGEYRYNWDTTTASNGAEYLIRAIATDDIGATASDTSNASFEITNKLVVYAPSTTVVNQSLITGVTYNTYSGPPVDNATVIFSIGDSQYHRTTNATGIAIFTPQTIELINITAFKSGYLPADMVTVEVIHEAYSFYFTCDHDAKSTFTNVTATYTLTLKNTGHFSDNYTLIIENPDSADSLTLNGNVTKLDDTHYETVDISGDESIIILLNVTNSSIGTLRVNVTAASTGDSTKVEYVNTTTTVEGKDITSPVITFVVPTPVDGALINLSSVNIRVAVNEICTIAYLNWNGVNETMNGSGTTFYLNKTGLLDDLYTYKVYANDTTGNMGKSETRVVTVDTTPPPSVSNLNGSAIGQTWINWTWTNPIDQLAGFDHAEIQLWEAGSLDKSDTTSKEFYRATGLKSDTTYEIRVKTMDRAGNANHTWITDMAKTLSVPPGILDAGRPEKPYPSIQGIHNGTLTPSQNITVSRLYTYPCPGTGGHTEYVRIWNHTLELDVNASWNGYKGDWHNISFNESFILEASETYNFTLRTGSYPQIHHAPTLLTTNGWINCTEFTDANGEKHSNWIPAIRLFR